VAIAQELVPEVEGRIDEILGASRARALRRDLRALSEAVAGRPVD
jgi:hypothetical protein